jgi:DNA-binding CsgD family transcriptional regulator
MSLKYSNRAALTEVQTIIFYLFAQGHTTNAMAEKLGLSDQQVEGELKRVCEKLGLLDRLELMLFAYAEQSSRCADRARAFPEGSGIQGRANPLNRKENV